MKGMASPGPSWGWRCWRWGSAPATACRRTRPTPRSDHRLVDRRRREGRDQRPPHVLPAAVSERDAAPHADRGGRDRARHNSDVDERRPASRQLSGQRRMGSARLGRLQRGQRQREQDGPNLPGPGGVGRRRDAEGGARDGLLQQQLLRRPARHPPDQHALLQHGPAPVVRRQPADVARRAVRGDGGAASKRHGGPPRPRRRRVDQSPSSSSRTSWWRARGPISIRSS